jgi:hypothetical protein
MVASASSCVRYVETPSSLECIALTRRDHLVGHRRPDQPRAYGIDTDAACCIFESRALGEPKDTVLGGMVDSALGATR